MKVLVVGSSGFLGGWVKKLLLEDNEHDVIAVSYTHLTLPTT